MSLAQGAKVDLSRRGESPSPLMTALQKGYNDIAKLLLEHAATVNRVPGTDGSQAPLLLATRGGDEGILKLLRARAPRLT